jgi:hypothetical protein
MKKIQDNNKWFSIVLAMWITIVVWMISILILEYIIPFSRNIKWVENSSSAYYHAYAWVEESLWFLSQKNIWTPNNVGFTPSATWSSHNLVSMTSEIPPSWYGNTELNDKDWNMFDQNTPIQLSLIDSWGVKISNIDFSDTNIIFRSPNISWSWSHTLSGWTLPLVNWIFSWINAAWEPVVLNASWSLSNNNYITVDNVNAGNTIDLWVKDGITLTWDKCTVQQFYDNLWPCAWNKWLDSEPTLKFSIINKLDITPQWIIPYIEYKMEFLDGFTPVEIPWRYSQIETAWKSYWYKKHIDIKIPQLSTNQAFDFAVFQYCIFWYFLYNSQQFIAKKYEWNNSL